MSAVLKNKKLYKLEYDSIEHQTRADWLRKNASLSEITETMEVSDDGATISLELLLDDVIFQRYLKEFEPEIWAENKWKSR